MAILIAAAAGVLFGGADQYLGSLIELGAWTYSVSAMSAPWLVLPFVAGSTQRGAGRAALLGIVATAAALAGYFAMTLSPIEGVPLSHFPNDLYYLVNAQMPYIIGGAVTAPLFGYLGQRWWTERSWTSALLVAAALCLEPLARVAVGKLSPPNIVWWVEVTSGACLACYFLISGVMYRQRPDGLANVRT